MNAPTSFRAGDSVSWTETLAAYPASAGWALKYRLLWSTGTAVAITATASGDGFAVTLSATDTAAWTAGAATLVSWVEKGTQRVTLAQQAVTILPNLAAAATYDGRSQAQKALADAKAALAAYMANGQIHVAEYEIAGRRMKFRSSAEIRDLINHYEREVAAERALQALLEGGTPGRVLTRF
ncbi:MAG: hypothetical protein AB1409_08155 [Pseudomonadota bacterium]